MGYTLLYVIRGSDSVSGPYARIRSHPPPRRHRSTAGLNETDTQSRHGVSLATVQGRSLWAVLGGTSRPSPLIRQQCVALLL